MEVEMKIEMVPLLGTGQNLWQHGAGQCDTGSLYYFHAGSYGVIYYFDRWQYGVKPLFGVSKTRGHMLFSLLLYGVVTFSHTPFF